MTFALDTNPCVEVLRSRHPDVVARYRATNPHDIVIPSMVAGATLVTHNGREFSRVSGLSLIDWQV